MNGTSSISERDSSCVSHSLSAQAVAGSHSRDDGIVVIGQANYQALQAIKHELINLTGVLRSWNQCLLWLVGRNQMPPRPSGSPFSSHGRDSVPLSPNYYDLFVL